MSIPKALVISSLLLFLGIGTLGISKKMQKTGEGSPVSAESREIPVSSYQKEAFRIFQEAKTTLPLPSIDRVWQLFTKGEAKLPIVKTITYTSSVDWLSGRPAWLGDYAAHFGTSKHFISRSLTGDREYFSQVVSPGSTFNVFTKDKIVEFHLVVDTAHCKMAFYYVDLDTEERVLLKVYSVGLGRLSEESLSGTLTPYGVYQLGDKAFIYKPGNTTLFHEQKTEMVRLFGSRWLPFGQEVQDCSEPARGYGIQGAPWKVDEDTGELVEDKACINRYFSDGSICMLREDVEELYAIVLTKPTFVHITKHLDYAKLPGVEVAAPSR